MPQAQNFTVTSNGQKTFEVLSPAGNKTPAEYRLLDATSLPANLPYLSIKADSVSGSVARRLSLLFVSPSVIDGKRAGQNVYNLTLKLDGQKSADASKADIDLLLAILSHAQVKEALAKAIAPN